jgi:NADH dehydrogenase
VASVDCTPPWKLERLLSKDRSIEITLVNRENFFLFTPMLHEVAASDLDITTIVNPIRKLLRQTNFFDGEVRSIDLIKKRVIVSHGIDRTRITFRSKLSSDLDVHYGIR